MTRYSTALLTIILLVASSTMAAAVSSPPVPAPPVSVTLIPESRTFGPGQSLKFLFRFDIQPGWHTYWKNPGTAGQPAGVTWDLPVGWKTLGLGFPVPVRLEQVGKVIFGYENEASLVYTLVAPATAPGKPATLNVSAVWTAGRNDEEAAERVTFRLVMRPGPSGAAPAELGEAVDLIPGLGHPATIRKVLMSGWNLEFPAGLLGGAGSGDLEFFPENRQGVDFSKPILGRVKGNRAVFPVLLDREVLRGVQVQGFVRTGDEGPGLRVFADVPEPWTGWIKPLVFLALVLWGMFVIQWFGRKSGSGKRPLRARR